MIVRLTGALVEVTEEAAIIERDGVAREVLVPRFSVGELAAYRGQQVTLHTVEFYEGNQTSGQLTPRILGFLHKEDRLFFSRFVGVKGIGPRKALKALAQPVRRIASWIETSDTKSMATLPGVGPRAAEMIVATLKGKVSDLAIGEITSGSKDVAELSRPQRDALEVLVAWGDPRSEAEKWIERAGQLHPDTDSADEWVRVAYRVKSGVEG
jgi:holliday junction DNA helicase RuvA